MHSALKLFGDETQIIDFSLPSLLPHVRSFYGPVGVCECVVYFCLPVCFIYSHVRVHIYLNLSPHTFRFTSVRICIHKVWHLPPGYCHLVIKYLPVKMAVVLLSRKDQFWAFSRVNTWCTHLYTWEQAQNCWLKPACILTNISNSFSPPTVRMRYNPISNLLRVIGSLSQSHRRAWIQNPFCKVSIHLRLYITADRKKQNIAGYECHAHTAAFILMYEEEGFRVWTYSR